MSKEKETRRKRGRAKAYAKIGLKKRKDLNNKRLFAMCGSNPYCKVVEGEEKEFLKRESKKKLGSVSSPTKKGDKNGSRKSYEAT